MKLLTQKYVIGKPIGTYENHNQEFKRSLDKRKSTIKKYIKSFCNNCNQKSYLVYGVNDEGTIVGLPETQTQLDNVQKTLDTIQEEICLENDIVLVNFITIHILNCYNVDGKKTLQNVCIFEIDTTKLNNYYIDSNTGKYYQLMIQVDQNVPIRLNASTRKIIKRLNPLKISDQKLDKLNKMYNQLQLNSAEKIQDFELSNKVLINQLDQSTTKSIEQLNEIHQLKQQLENEITRNNFFQQLYSSIGKLFECNTNHSNKFKINYYDFQSFDPLYV